MTKKKKKISTERPAKTWGFPLTRRTPITDEILVHYGFKKLPEKDAVERDIWRMKMPFYPYYFQFIKGDYPANNPNCGILSIHEPAHEATGFDKNGRKKVYKFPASTRSIAWYVNTAERLRSIILILSEENV